MTWPHLKDARQEWYDGRFAFSRTGKHTIREDRLSGIRAFCLDLIDSQPLAMAMLRHGFQTPEAKTWQSHPELAKAAYSARRQCRRGKHISKRVNLSGPARFSKQDQLYKQMMKANDAWGHGQGTEKKLSREKVAMMALETRSLTQYCQQE